MKPRQMASPREGAMPAAASSAKESGKMSRIVVRPARDSQIP